MIDDEKEEVVVPGGGVASSSDMVATTFLGDFVFPFAADVVTIKADSDSSLV
jgi:hypothetical protein